MCSVEEDFTVVVEVEEVVGGEEGSAEGVTSGLSPSSSYSSSSVSSRRRRL